MFSGLGGIHPPSQSREGPAQRGQGLRETIRRYGSSLALQVGAGRRTSQSSLGSLSQLNGGGLWQRPGGDRGSIASSTLRACRATGLNQNNEETSTLAADPPPKRRLTIGHLMGLSQSQALEPTQLESTNPGPTLSLEAEPTPSLTDTIPPTLPPSPPTRHGGKGRKLTVQSQATVQLPALTQKTSSSSLMHINEAADEDNPMMLDMGTQMSACRGGYDSVESLNEGSVAPDAKPKEKGKDAAGQDMSLSQASTDISTSQVIEAVNESRDFIDQRLGEAHNELKNDIEAAAREIVAEAMAEESAKLKASFTQVVADSSAELRSEFRAAQEKLHLRLKALGIEIEAIHTTARQPDVMRELDRLKGIEITCEETKSRLDQIETTWAERFKAIENRAGAVVMDAPRTPPRATTGSRVLTTEQNAPQRRSANVLSTFGDEIGREARRPIVAAARPSTARSAGRMSLLGSAAALRVALPVAERRRSSRIQALAERNEKASQDLPTADPEYSTASVY
ncbi:hypothetical protein FOL46_000419 [Perkinsus olseni]|uniref:Uncharacterized protein n=1 Tax=Perkinsus olseni TaxID=32597 RepID=A0A7J6KVA2_PEROL|nr:hypothetical protein FOL46_000419 [Perkinsus olseni]